MKDQSERAGGDGRWQLALREPTIEMCHAAADFHAEGCWDASDQSLFGGIYKAMLAATPPSGNAGERTEPVAWRCRSTGPNWHTSWALFNGSKKPVPAPLNNGETFEAEPLYAAPPQPAPDALQRAIKALAEAYRRVGGKMLLGYHVADDLDAIVRLSPPLPSSEPLAGDGTRPVGRLPESPR